VFPNGEVQYLHPKDGVYPEKANPGTYVLELNPLIASTTVVPFARLSSS
jgi:photosystem I subunit 2